MNDTINRQDAIDTHCRLCLHNGKCPKVCIEREFFMSIPKSDPDLSAYSDKLWRAAYERGKKEATLHGYKIEHLVLIANLLEKENLSPKSVSDALQDIGRVVDIVKTEFEEVLRKAVEH